MRKTQKEKWEGEEYFKQVTREEVNRSFEHSKEREREIYSWRKLKLQLEKDDSWNE